MAISIFVGKSGFNEQYNLSDERNKGKYELEVSYEGCVLRIGEHNYYDDSDFYAVVWDEETQSTRKITYATTRAWTTYNHAERDATDEVRKKADAYELKVSRAIRAKKLSEINAEDRRISLKHNISIKSLRQFKGKVSSGSYDVCYELLSKNIRSSFKKSLRERLINWLNEKDSKYESPFSKKQWEALFQASQPFKLYY